jgi:hypothetical protein
MPTPQEFYSRSHEGNAFKQKGALYNALVGHRGQDFNGWPLRTPIPTYRAGTVVSNYWSSALGWVLVLQFPDGKYGGWSHLDEKSPHEVGTRLAFGSTIGLLGTTGRLTTGPHSHNTLSSSSRLPGSGAVEDPLPYIRVALETLTPAGTITTPLEDTLSAAEVADIKKHIDTRAAELDAQLDALRATQLAHQNLFVEEINTVGNGRVAGGLRGLIVNGIAVSQVNQDLLAKENDGGIRSMVSTVIGLLQRVVKKLGA